MENWTVQYTSGGSLITVNPLVDASSKYILISSGSSVRVYSTLTGERVASFVGHTKSITAIICNPFNTAQIYTSSIDGTIRLWSLIDSSCVKVISMDNNSPIVNMVVDSVDPSMAYVIIELTNSPSNITSTTNTTSTLITIPTSSQWNYTNKRWRLIEFNLVSGKRGRTLVKGGGSCKGLTIRPIFSSNNEMEGAIDSKKMGCYVSIINGKELIVWNSEKQFIYKWTHKEELTSLAIHPNEDFVATGDARGKLTIWYCLGGSGLPVNKNVHTHNSAEVVVGQEENIIASKSSGKSLVRKLKVSTTTHHWHAHALTSLCFSAGNGEVLLSGGEEAVLVLWHLNSGSKSFLPRRGGPINKISVSPNGDSYALSLDTNTIQYIKTSTLKVSWSLNGLGIASEKSKSHLKKSLDAGMKVDPFSGNLVLNGSSSGAGAVLQFFNIASDQHVNNLNVKSHNFVSRVDDETLYPSVVSLFAFSEGGNMLVTVDKRKHQKHIWDTSLQFWDKKGSNVGEYALNSRLDNPHNDGISVLLFHPKQCLVVTGGNDGIFKVWNRTKKEVSASIAFDLSNKGSESSSSSMSESKWFCISSGYYRKGCPISAASFSDDGSLLALSYQSIITLWDIQHNTLLHTLSHPPSTTIKSVSFLPNTNFLVATLDNSLSVWNILTSSISWSIITNILSICVDKVNTGNFAIAVGGEEGNGDSVLVFSSLSHIPLLSWKLPNGVSIESLTFNAHGSASFVLMLSNHELCQFGAVDEKEKATGSDKLLAIHDISKSLHKELVSSKLPTAFEQVFGLSSSVSYDGTLSKFSVSLSNTLSSSTHAEKVKEYLNAPSHILPPPSALFNALADGILVRAQDKNMNEIETNNKEVKSHSPSVFLVKKLENKNHISKLINSIQRDLTPPVSLNLSVNVSEVQDGNNKSHEEGVKMFNQSMTSFFQTSFRSPPGQVSDEDNISKKRKRQPSPTKEVKKRGSSPTVPERVSKRQIEVIEEEEEEEEKEESVTKKAKKIVNIKNSTPIIVKRKGKKDEHVDTPALNKKVNKTKSTNVSKK